MERIGTGPAALRPALCGDEVVWFWIGSHSDYGQLLKELGP